MTRYATYALSFAKALSAPEINRLADFRIVSGYSAEGPKDPTVSKLPTVLRMKNQAVELNH
jgi:hypothetical protein